MKLQRKNLMLSDVEEGNNLMLTRLGPVATLVVNSNISRSCLTVRQKPAISIFLKQRIANYTRYSPVILQLYKQSSL